MSGFLIVLFMSSNSNGSDKTAQTHLSIPWLHISDMSLVVRKPAFCICENKDADQLRGNHEADQRLCFRHTDSEIFKVP